MTKKALGHHDDLKPDYPTFTQFAAASKLLTGYLRGGDKPSIAEAAKAGWVCLGYAESYIPEQDDKPIMGTSPANTDEAKAQFLEEAVEACKQHKGAGIPAFNWRELAKIVLSIITAILAGG